MADDAEAIRAAARRAVRRGGRQQARAGHRRQPELVDPDSGHRRRLPADPQLAARKYGAFFTQQDVNSAPKVAVLGNRRRRTRCSETDVDPTGQIIRIRNQPFKVIGVMATKGTGAMGQRSGRRRSSRRTRPSRRSFRASSTSTTSRCRPADGRDRAGRRVHRAGPAERATSSSATTRTTSWSGRSRRWRASAPRPPRR